MSTSWRMFGIRLCCESLIGSYLAFIQVGIARCYRSPQLSFGTNIQRLLKFVKTFCIMYLSSSV
jgi:hypothetical protein